MSRIAGSTPFRKAKNIRRVGLSRSRLVGMSGLVDDLFTTVQDAAGMIYSGESSSTPTKTSGTAASSASGTAAAASGTASGTSTATGPAITGVRNIQNTLLGFQISIGSSGADGTWGPCTAQGVRTAVTRLGRAEVVRLFGEDVVRRAETESGRCGSSSSTGPSTTPGAPATAQDALDTVSSGTGTGLSALLSRLVGGAASSPLQQILPRTTTSPLTDPLFLGLIALGIVGGVVGYTAWKKSKSINKGK